MSTYYMRLICALYALSGWRILNEGAAMSRIFKDTNWPILIAGSILGIGAPIGALFSSKPLGWSAYPIGLVWVCVGVMAIKEMLHRVKNPQQAQCEPTSKTESHEGAKYV